MLLPVGWPVLLIPLTPDGRDAADVEVALTFRDEAIDESSGLVVRENLVLTVNDSGDGPLLYSVDRVTGQTTGVTTFADEDPVDVEALAPGRGRTVWVGDIGDNARVRETIEVHRFRPVPGGGRVEAARFSLRYPDGPHDAEALLVHPRTGRVLVVTKRPFVGGVVYAAPRRLESGVVHRLERVGSVPGMVTDGAFLPGGARVVLRTYGTAAVHAYPGFEQLRTFDLPEQEQGEAIAVGPDGRLYLGSEGERSDVLVVDLPAQESASGPTGGSPTASPPTDDEAADADAGAEPRDESGGASGDTSDAGPEPGGEADRPGLWRPARYGAVAVTAAGAVALWLRAARRRGRRRR